MARPTFPVLTDDDGSGLIGTIINNAKVNEIKEYITKGLELKDLTELTIASGVITITEAFHTVDTEADAETDDLDTISGGTTGALLVLKAENGARTVVVKHNTGNIWLKGGADLSLDDVEDGLLLIFTGTKWIDLGAGVGGDGGADFYSRALVVSRWEDIDSFNTIIDTGGAVTQGSVWIELKTAATTGYRVYVRMLRYPFCIFDKNIDAQFYINPSTLTDCLFACGLGSFSLPSGTSDKYVAFYYESAALIAACCNGTSKTTETITGVDASARHFYKIHYEAATKAEFYVDGTLKATITTNLPSTALPSGGLQIAVKTEADVEKKLYGYLLVAEHDM